MMTWTCDVNDAPTEYTIVMSSETTEAERVAAMLAASEWEYAVPVRLNVTVDWCPIQPTADGFLLPASLGIICIRPARWFDGSLAACVSDQGGHVAATTRWRDDGGAGIWLFETIIQKHVGVLAGVIAHELGHAMRLDHDDEGNVMGPNLEGEPEEPTDCDIEQWMRAHAASIGPDGEVL